MKINKEVVLWLRENAYAIKDEQAWFLPDFPDDKIPHHLMIPVTPGFWKSFREVSHE
jgi:hypothetical protein